MKIEDPIFCTIPCTELVKRELKADMHAYIKTRIYVSISVIFCVENDPSYFILFIF